MCSLLDSGEPGERMIEQQTNHKEIKLVNNLYVEKEYKLTYVTFEFVSISHSETLCKFMRYIRFHFIERIKVLSRY